MALEVPPSDVSGVQPINLYTKNVSRLQSSKAVDDVLGEIDQAKPRCVYMSEVSDPYGNQTFAQALVGELQDRGFATLLTRYTEDDRLDQHTAAAGVRDGALKSVSLAGRRAVEMTISYPGGSVVAVGIHANDQGAKRKAEFAVLVAEYGECVKAAEPLVVLGCFNNGKASLGLTAMLHAAGWIAQMGADARLWRPAPTGLANPPVIPRLVSLSIRSSAQVDASEVGELIEGWDFITANPDNRPTALVPLLPERLMQKLRRLEPIMYWLSQPHIASDGFLASQGSFGELTLYPVREGDKHVGASTTYYPS